MTPFRLDEKVNDRYEQLLGKEIIKENRHLPKSFVVNGKVTDPWLEDLEWVFLNDLGSDYEGVKINENKNVIHFLFSDDFARHKALNIIQTRFEGYNIKPVLGN